MKKHPLPAAFVAFLQDYIRTDYFTTPTRLHRGLILRWCLWADGHAINALPGYDTCPPATKSGFPAGWTVQAFRDIARETIGIAAIQRRLRRASRAA